MPKINEIGICMTVYLVSTGSYSDYAIEAIFSTKKLAEQFIKEMEFDEYSEVRIREYKVDEIKPYLEKGYKQYFVRLNKSNFGLLEIKILKGRSIDKSKKVKIDNNGNYYTHCWAKNEKHAIKIANDRCAMHKSMEVVNA